MLVLDEAYAYAAYAEAADSRQMESGAAHSGGRVAEDSVESPYGDEECFHAGTGIVCSIDWSRT